ncbi:MAG: YwiC-like family protein [Acidobacteriota bacterium]
MQNISAGAKAPSLANSAPSRPNAVAFQTVPVKKTLPAVRIGQIALPTEHGGWGLLLEPLIAGLAIAFSLAGCWIALMTIGAFLTRQPLKVLVIDRRGMRVNERAKVATAFVLAYGAVFVLGLGGAILTGGFGPLLPFAIVLPLAAVQIYFDFSRKSRQLLPELGGAIAISVSIAAIMLAAGTSWTTAAAFWAIFVARLIPSILYVRERLLLEKGKAHSRAIPIATHVTALSLVAFLAYNGLSPILTVLAMVLLLYRSVEGLSAGRTKMKAMKIGVYEVAYGVITLLSVVIGHYTGF